MSPTPVELKPVVKKTLAVPSNFEKLKQIQLHVEKEVKAQLQLMNGAIQAIPVISSGSLDLDCALGVGGYPYGRIIEVFGPESSGKTTLTLHAIASAQAKGGIAAFIDVEHALDVQYAKNLRVKHEELLILQPDSGEQALQTVEALTGVLSPGDIIVVDSVAALTTQAEIDGDIGDMHMAQTARLMSNSLKKIVPLVAKAGVILYFTNQVRDTIGNQGYGPATDTPGGRALKFYASQRLQTKREGAVTATVDGKTVNVANKTVITVKKNKVAPPFAEAHVMIRFGQGISKLDEILDLGLRYKKITQTGSYFKMGDTTLGQGREKTLEFLEANPKIASEIESDVRTGLGIA